MDWWLYIWLIESTFLGRRCCRQWWRRSWWATSLMMGSSMTASQVVICCLLACFFLDFDLWSWTVSCRVGHGLMETEGQYCLLHAYVVSRNLCCLLAFCVSYVPIDIMFIKLSHDSMFVCIWLMVGCNLCVELNVLSGYMYHVPVLSYRFPIVIDMFPTDMFRSRYPVISVPFSRPLFPFPFPFPAKKNRNRNGLGVFPTVPDCFQP